PEVSVVTQTDESWLASQYHRKLVQFKVKELPKCYHRKDSFESKFSKREAGWPQDLIDVGVFADAELQEDYLKLMGLSLQSLPSIGPPTILAYKQESRQKPKHPSTVTPELKLEWDGMHIVCEFCGRKVKPIPLIELKVEHSKKVFCCKQARKLHEFLLREQEYILGMSSIEKIPLSPHLPHSNVLERHRAREKAAQKISLKSKENIMIGEQASFISKAITRFTYDLSTPNRKDNWIIVPPPDKEKLKDETCYFIPLSKFAFGCNQMLQQQFLEKFYANGQKFLTVFPDSTVQLFYPSGNLAAVIVSNENKNFTCIIQEDKSTNAAIQAVFNSFGKGTCYHPNGVVWINYNAFGGQCLDQKGNRVRKWKWGTSQCLTPLKPIFMSLNHEIGVRILGQYHIFVTFLAAGKQAKLSVGAIVKQKVSDDLPSLMRNLSEEKMQLLTTKIKIQTLFRKLHHCLHFPSNEQLDGIKKSNILQQAS
uniref:FAM194 C-terminal domain-containing protein n=1 Tax=Latimeria chalumnae TaxID=7897 RepID=H3A517_LATCH